MLCSPPADGNQIQADLIRISDDRRGRMRALEASINDRSSVMVFPEECMANCRKMLRLLEEENPGTSNPEKARVYWDAFQIAIMNSDIARAVLFADRAWRIQVICEDGDSPRAQEMKSCKDHPESHASSGISQIWKTSANEIPRGNFEANEELWLWERARG